MLTLWQQLRLSCSCTAHAPAAHRQAQQAHKGLPQLLALKAQRIQDLQQQQQTGVGGGKCAGRWRGVPQQGQRLPQPCTALHTNRVPPNEQHAGHTTWPHNGSLATQVQAGLQGCRRGGTALHCTWSPEISQGTPGTGMAQDQPWRPAKSLTASPMKAQYRWLM